MRRRRFLRLLAGGALGAGLAEGCGGGGGTGGTTGGQEPDPATRIAALAAVESGLGAVEARRLTRPARLQAVADLLATRPEYEASGVDAETECVWGRFADDRLHVLAFNRYPSRSVQSPLPPPPAARATPALLPSSVQARLLHSFGLNFTGGQSALTDIRSWLNAAGYQVLPGLEGDARVDKLRQVQGDGLFYINTHGGPGLLRPGGPDAGLFCLQSSTLANEALERVPEYRDDLAAKRLVYFTAPNGLLDAQGNEVYDTRYGITTYFVKQYWSFAPNSIVFFNACHSGNSQAAPAAFLAACLGKSAGVCLGWSNAVEAQTAFHAVRYFVSRLLGYNQFEKENPDQRPFDWASVLADMARKGYDTSPGTGAKLLAFGGGASAKPHLLAPAIEQMRFDDTSGDLHLLGQFGDQRGTVKIAGAERAPKSWTPDRIVCEVQSGEAGDVQVFLGPRKSNVRRITRWNLTLQTRFLIPEHTGLTVTGPVTLRLRADIGEFREQAGKTPIAPVRPAYPTPEGKADLTASGTVREGDCTTTWSGHQVFPVMTARPNGAVLAAVLQIDTANHRGNLGLSLGALTPPFTQTTVCPDRRDTSKFMSTFGLLDGDILFQNALTLDPILPLSALVVGFNNDWTLQAGAFEDPDGLVKITWNATAADFPPSPAAVRHAP